MRGVGVGHVKEMTLDETATDLNDEQDASPRRQDSSR